MENNEQKKQEIVNELVEKMQEILTERANQPDPYVVAIYRTKDDSLVGYHADSCCSVTQDKMNGKRYHGDNPYKQLDIIRKNIDHVINTDLSKEVEDGLAGLFTGISRKIKEKHYKNNKPEDIYIMAEYLEGDIPPVKYEYKIIGNG